VTTPDHTARYCADLVAGLADAGVDTAFLSPGSRNTPLTIAFIREPRINNIAIRDERSGGFAALGHGKATGRPAVVLCTSGSAAAHYFPAIVEANQAASPLIVLTADRPARLRGTGAPQTMDQINLYGRHVKSFTDLDIATGNARSEGRVLATFASFLPAGPVHANVSFDEPLLPDTMPQVPHAMEWEPPVAEEPQHGDLLESLTARRVLIVASGRQQPGFQNALDRVAAALGAPIIADPQCWVVGANTVEYGDLLATSRYAFAAAPPDVVLRLGPIPTSKPLSTWLEESGVEQILVDKSRLRDPLGSAAVVIDQDPTVFLVANAPNRQRDAASDDAFLNQWLDMDTAVRDAMSASIDGLPFPNEPAVARILIATARPGDLVFLGSSMPIRDVDAFAQPRSDIAVLANRGVNGIDGTISTAMGAALAGNPVTLLVGDVAALHDATALSEVARLNVPLRIVVVNNDGGGIFSFLPQARSEIVGLESFEQHWGTPHGLSLQRIAQAMGVNAVRVETASEYLEELSAAIDGPSLIEVHSNREQNVEHHRQIRSSARSVLRQDVE
jgi:2-succinyl-5-enolpyruvyl-6-hydroxy-3-cyclohexene-1-carboxylate synthase